VIHVISIVVCVWLLWSAEICYQRLVLFDLILTDTKYVTFSNERLYDMI